MGWQKKFFFAVSVLLFLPGAVSAASAGKEYTIQVMFGANKDVAESFSRRLQEKDFAAYVLEVQGESGNMFYKVRIGRFITENDAWTYGSRLQSERVDYWVTRYVAPVAVQTGAVAPENADKAGQVKQVAVSDTPKDLETDNSSAAEEAQPAVEPVVQPAAVPLSEGGAKQSAVNPGQPEAAAEALPKKDFPAESGAGWPAAQSRIYKYYDLKGVLHVTNAYGDVPDQYRANLAQIIFFPVAFRACDLKTAELTVEVSGDLKQLVLDGIAAPAKPVEKEIGHDFEKLFSQQPLRLSYDPRKLDDKGRIHGELFMRSGQPFALELIRRGLFVVSAAQLPVFRRKLLLSAQEQAQNAGAGCWGGEK
ncbi:MAG: hypothetical protein GY868_06235 [Deltaproteobacteria bacterium]|nr:hypothetical protein [Deltaproteobacteria bacterium]